MSGTENRDERDSTHRRARGEQTLRELVGENYLARFAEDRESGAFGWYLSDHSVGSCFADIWGRDGLDRRSRVFTTLGILMALGEIPAFKTYVRVALRDGVQEREVEELVTHAIPYLGYPRAGALLRAAREALGDDSLIPLASDAARRPSTTAE